MPLNPWHMTELNSIWKTRDETKPILFFYTDGGPDHRLTYISAKLSLIALFLERDLDYLCAVRTPPHLSWKNPLEQIMSILNIALQSVGLMRGATHSFEEKLRNSNNLSAIQDLGHKNPGLREEVAGVMEST